MTAAVVFKTLLVIVDALLIAYLLNAFCELWFIPKMDGIVKRLKKKNLFCKHEWIEKTSWKVYEFARCNDHISVELQCRKCGKKKTICIYENEVM